MSDLNTFLNEHVFTKLNDRQRRIIMYRQFDVFGFGKNEKTYREISKSEQIGVERIRQIALKAKHIIENRLHNISEAQKSPHIIIKKVMEAELTPNLPMRQKFFCYLDDNIPVRILNCLKNEDLMLVDRLIEKTDSELLSIPNFGKKSLRQIKEILARHGLELSSGKMPPMLGYGGGKP